jgi:prolyl-tRNA synthetase
MADGKALQMATSHNLGQNFSKAFSIKFLGEDGKEAMPWYTTWAFSTRLLGAMIMVHGDDKGIVIPPRISPLHCAIVPIYYSKEDREKVLEKARELKKTIESSGDFKCEIDLRDDKTPGWKYSEWEMKGIPLRIELGKRDMEKNQVTIVRRDTGEKLMIPEGEFAQKFPKLLDEIQDNLFRRAKKFLDGGISEVNSMQEFSRVLEEEKGFVRGKWCSGRECEEEIKTKTGATCRLIPFEAPSLEPGAKCFACGKEAQCEALFAKSY